MLVHWHASALRLTPESPEDSDLLDSLADFFAKSAAYDATTREEESPLAERGQQQFVARVERATTAFLPALRLHRDP